MILSVIRTKAHAKENTRWPSLSLTCWTCLTRSAWVVILMWSAPGWRWCSRRSSTRSSTEFIGAEPHERTPDRTNQRNGGRHRLLSTKAGDVELKIPKLRHGSFFPSVLERRRRIDRALFAVVIEAYVHGVSTRKVDDLVAALGLESGISKSEVSRICAELDVTLEAFRTRSLEHVEFVYVLLDATYVKARVGGRVVSRAVVVATGISCTGDREVLGVDVGDSEDGAFWTAFLRSLRARGLHGVQLVISDAHTGLVSAIDAVLIGASWQRCRVHFMRNVLAKIPPPRARWSRLRSARSSPNPMPNTSPPSSTRSPRCSPASSRSSPTCSPTRADLLAFSAFPAAHWRKIWSTNPIERLHKEIKRRTNVVGIFPNDAALLRLVTAVIAETHDEWQVCDRRYLSERSMAALYDQPDEPVLLEELTAAKIAS